MVTYAQLAGMDTSKLTGAAEAAGGLSGSLSGHADAVQTAAQIPQGMWQGDDSVAAGNLVADQSPPLFDASDAFNQGKGALEGLVEGIDAAKEHLQGAHDAVAGTGITIGGDGTVTTPVVDSPDVAAHNDELARQARQIIDEALQMAGDADDTAVNSINSTSQGALDSYLEAFPENAADLDRATELFGTELARLNPEQVTELNDLLSQHGDDPLFAAEFARRMGAEGFVDQAAAFADVGTALYDSGDAETARIYQDLQ
ncbi:MAG: hypothetical protein ACRDXX_05755, partial [Stackebrandtia sp.]